MSLFNKIAARFKVSETKLKVFRNLYWAVLGKVVTLLGSLLVGIMVARYLGPEQYGLMRYVISYVALFQVFASFGLDNIEIREESKAPDKRDSIVGTAFVIRVFFAVITMLLIIISAILFEADAYTKWMIAIYSLSVLFNVFAVVRNHFTSLIWNEYVVKSEISRTLIGMLIKAILLWIHASLTWFIIAVLFDALILATGYITSYQKKIASIRDWTFDKSLAFYLIRESYPLVVSLSAVIIYQRVDQIMLGKMLDTASVGFYAVAASFVEIFLFVPQIIAQTVTPILVRTYNTDIVEYQKKVQNFVNITVWLCVCMAVLGAMCAFWLIKFTYGEQYLAAVVILQVLIFKIIPNAMSSTAGQTIIIERKQKYAWIRNVTACALCVGLNYFLIPQYGVLGAAVSSILVTLYAGTLSNIFIPSYHSVLKIQMRALFCGWKDLFGVVKYIK